MPAEGSAVHAAYKASLAPLLAPAVALPGWPAAGWQLAGRRRACAPAAAAATLPPPFDPWLNTPPAPCQRTHAHTFPHTLLFPTANTFFRPRLRRQPQVLAAAAVVAPRTSGAGAPDPSPAP